MLHAMIWTASSHTLLAVRKIYIYMISPESEIGLRIFHYGQTPFSFPSRPLPILPYKLPCLASLFPFHLHPLPGGGGNP